MTSRVCRLIVSLCGGWLALSAPTAAQRVSFEVVGSVSTSAEVVRVSGTHAYVAAGQTLSVFDVKDPAAPKLTSTLKFTDIVHSIATAGSMVYLANGLPGLAIVDASRPDFPAVVGSYRTPGEAYRVVVSGTRVLVSNRMSGVEIIEVSNVSKPTSVGAYYTDGYTRDVAVAGSVAYIVDSTDFAVVDVSKPESAAALSIQQMAVTPTTISVPQTGPAAQGGKTAYLLGGDVLQVFDVSDPARPKTVTTYKLPARAQAAAVEGSFAYVAAGADGLQVIDLSDRAKPAVAGSYKTPGPARDLALAGALIFIAVGRAAGDKSNATGTFPPGILILRRGA